MIIINRLIKIVLLLLFFILNLSCSSTKIYEADWVLTSLSLDNQDITNQVTSFNMSISQSIELTIPRVDLKKFKGLTQTRRAISEIEKRDGKYWIRFEAVGFFNDEFELLCLDENCCSIRLWNENKSVELIYSGEIGLTTSKSRRDCPDAREIIKKLPQF